MPVLRSITPSRRKGGGQGPDPVHWIMSNTDRLHEVTDKVDISHVPPLLTMPPLPIHLPAGRWHAPQGWPYSMPVVAPLIAAARKGVALGEVHGSLLWVSVCVCAHSLPRRFCLCRSCMNAEGRRSRFLALTALLAVSFLLELGHGPESPWLATRGKEFLSGERKTAADVICPARSRVKCRCYKLK